MTKPVTTQSMMHKVIRKAKAENVDDVLTPKSARVVSQFTDELNNPVPRSLTDLDQFRKKAQIAAASPDPSDARVGAMMIDEIDDFMDNLSAKSFTGTDKANVAKIGERYKAARSLWGRARRAELVGDAFKKAELQASGFENGIRTQLRQIVTNPKRKRFFTKSELSAMEDVIRGSSSANVLKLVGRLGFSEGAATNVLGGLVGMGVLGPGAPVVGQVSRKFAQRATKQAAKKMDNLIRSGASGREVARFYLQSVPKSKRTIVELSDMLLISGSQLDDLLKSSSKITREAAEITRARRLFDTLQAAGVAAPTIIPQEEQ